MWKHKKYKDKEFKSFRIKLLDGKTIFRLVYSGPRGGTIRDEYFSWQDAKLAGWIKVK